MHVTGQAGVWLCLTSWGLYSLVLPGRRKAVYRKSDYKHSYNNGLEAFAFISLHDEMLRIFETGD